jgi:hypothetical protein
VTWHSHVFFVFGDKPDFDGVERLAGVRVTSTVSVECQQPTVPADIDEVPWWLHQRSNPRPR